MEAWLYSNSSTTKNRFYKTKNSKVCKVKPRPSLTSKARRQIKGKLKKGGGQYLNIQF
jgi:hypothetical protein